MFWYEWLGIILLIGLLITCITYLFICGMESLFPNLLDNPINKIADALSHSKSSYPRNKPRDRGVLHHNIGKNTEQGNGKTNNDNYENDSKGILAHTTSNIGGLVKRIITRGSK